jgi:anion-transporting  ArsA/GET3 family ATPase
VAKTISKFTGAETLQELARFMLAISGMNQRFRERSYAVQELLGAQETGFVLVTSPSAERLDEAIHFRTVLVQNHMDIASVVVNRVHPMPGAELSAAVTRLTEPLRAKAEATVSEARAMAQTDAAGIDALTAEVAGAPLLCVPRFEEDIHDLRGLFTTSAYLVGERSIDPPRAEGRSER